MTQAPASHNDTGQDRENAVLDIPDVIGAPAEDGGDGYRRQVLVVEDSELNREMLIALLEDEYDIIEAEDGRQGLEQLREHLDTLSAVLLDVYMPVCNGFEFLRISQNDPKLVQVPVVVATGSSSTDEEVRCLDLGASDFVTKPYNARVVRSRLKSVIRLRESASTLAIVERDDLTSALTRQAFMLHAAEWVKQNPKASFFIMTAKVQRFNSVSAALGRRDSARLLKYLSDCYLAMYPRSLVGRVEPDCFAVLANMKGASHQELHDQLQAIETDLPFSGIDVRYGVYENIDSALPVEEAVGRSMAASDAAVFGGRINVAYYDGPVSQRVIQEQAMAAEFDGALERGEFVPWYQPKIDVQTGELCAAEALVRWRKADGSMVSPGAFIPLFERDGLISQLDERIFALVCQFQADRQAAGKKVVPISVNLSRMSILSTGVVERYVKMANDAGIPLDMVPLEVTESMGIDDEIVLSRVYQLHDAGFPIHLDDFGSGFSSLATLTTLPLDVVKIDKTLMDKSNTHKGEQLIRFTTGLVSILGMKCVAEGVETQEQVELLRGTRCSMIQGYVYYAPKSQSDFEQLLDA